MQNPPHQRSESFFIQVITTSQEGDTSAPRPLQRALPSRPPNLSVMKVFNRFRKIIMRLVFSRRSSGSGGGSSDYKPEPPKTSCSSYYSSHTHYNEAIADCIEFFNKSSQEGWLSDGRNSDVNIV